MIARHSIDTRYPVCKLAEVVDFLDSQRRPVTESDRKPGPYPYYGANGIQGSIDRFIFDEPLVLLAEDGGHFDNPMRGIAYRINGKTWVNNHAHVLRPKPGIDANFICRVLENYDVTPFVTGTTRGKLTKAGAGEIPLPIPPFPEQRRIAGILDQADTLRVKRREALAQLDLLAQSIFLEMFGDPAANPKAWDPVPMSKLFAAPPVFGTMIPGDADRGSRLCLRVANIQNWQLDLTDSKFVDLPANVEERHGVRDGDLLLARAIATQEHLGKCIVARPGSALWAFDSHLMRLRFRADRALPDFIRLMLRTPGGRNLFLKASRKSSVQYNINTKEIAALELPIPPIRLQQTFATRIQAVEALKATHCAALSESDALFASLQHRAFSGQLL